MHESIFLSSPRATIKKKVCQNRENFNLAKQTTIFLPKINKVFWSTILQNLNERKVRSGQFFKNYSLYESKKMPSNKNLFRKIVETKNCDQNRVYPSPRLQYFTLFKRLKKLTQVQGISFERQCCDIKIAASNHDVSAIESTVVHLG